MFEKRMIVPLVGEEIKISRTEYDIGNGFRIVKKEFPIEERLRIFKDNDGHGIISESRINEASKSTKWLMATYKSDEFNKGSIDDGIEDKIHLIFTLFHIVNVTPLYPTVYFIDFKDDLSWKNSAMKNMTSTFYLHKTQIKPKYLIRKSHLEKVERMFSKINKHISTDFRGKNRIHRSIAFYKRAVETYPEHLRFLNYTIAIESLLSTSTYELSYRISQRAAWFLGKDGNDKKDIFSKMKMIYSLRSTIVHGGELNQKNMKNFDTLILLLEGYLRSSYFKILMDKKLIDIFSGPKKIDKYFEESMFA